MVYTLNLSYVLSYEPPPLCVVIPPPLLINLQSGHLL